MTAEIEQSNLATADPGADSCGLVVSVLRSLEDVAGLAPVWRTLTTEVNADPDFFATVIASRPEIVRPHVLTVERHGKLIAILVARLEYTSVKARLGYWNVTMARAKAIVTVYGGFLGERSEAVCRAMLESLRGALATGEAELLRLAPLPLDHPFHTVLHRETRGLLKSRGEEPIVHWQLALPESLDALLAMRSRKARHNIRNYRSKLERDYAGRIVYQVLTSTENLEALVHDIEAVIDKTYQRNLGVGFKDRADWRALLALGFKKGWLRVYMLRLDGVPAACGFGFIYRQTFFYAVTGYDPTFSHYSLGRYLMLNIIDDLCAVSTVTTLDYGFGDAEYKRWFATDHWCEAGVTLYATAARGVALWSAVRLTETAARGARWAVRRIGLEQRLKTLARRAFKRRDG